jgi:hypothetical protein
MARLRAEETVLRDRVLLPPEPEDLEEPEEQETPDSNDWIPLVEDRRHPYWQHDEPARDTSEGNEMTGDPAAAEVPDPAGPEHIEALEDDETLTVDLD